jgi:glucan endo-1,6-beta-glucosidase
MMDEKWGSGDPKEFLTDVSPCHHISKFNLANIIQLTFAAYDDHNYVKYSGVAQNKDAYIQHSCSDDRSGNWPVIVGEWSLSVDNTIEGNSEWKPENDKDFYKRWWAAQVTQYEKSAQGWVFWTWQTTGSLNDPRWDYKKAVDLGIIDKNPDVAYEMNICS